jgi:hypothetical protein
MILDYYSVRLKGGQNMGARWWLYPIGAIIGALAGYYFLPELWLIGTIMGMCIGLVLVAALASDRSRANEAPLHWTTNDALKRAIGASGVASLSFELRQVVVEEGDLKLTFYPTGSVPADKEHVAGLALRCVVGLTLPLVAANAKGVRVLPETAEYSVKLGSGVPLRAIVLQSGFNRAGPVQMRSAEEDGEWYVMTTHFTTMDDYQRQLQMQSAVFRTLVPVFETLRQEPIILKPDETVDGN